MSTDLVENEYSSNFFDQGVQRARSHRIAGKTLKDPKSLATADVSISKDATFEAKPLSAHKHGERLDETAAETL